MYETEHLTCQYCFAQDDTVQLVQSISTRNKLANSLGFFFQTIRGILFRPTISKSCVIGVMSGGSIAIYHGTICGTCMNHFCNILLLVSVWKSSRVTGSLRRVGLILRKASRTPNKEKYCASRLSSTNLVAKVLQISVYCTLP